MSKTRRSAAGFRVLVRRLEHGAGLPLPAYQSEGAAGLDLHAAVPEGKPLRIRPRQRILVPTGLVLELPPGSEGQVRPRSGLALRDGVTVLNAPGTIDADYRGEVQVLLVNLGDSTVVIRRGDRIAQLVVAPVARASLEVTVALSTTERGAGGFGSTDARAKDKAKAPRAAPVKKSTKPASVAARRKPGSRRSTGGALPQRR